MGIEKPKRYIAYRKDHRERGLCLICTRPAAKWRNGKPKSRCTRHLKINSELVNKANKLKKTA